MRCGDFNSKSRGFPASCNLHRPGLNSASPQAGLAEGVKERCASFGSAMQVRSSQLLPVLFSRSRPISLNRTGQPPLKRRKPMIRTIGAARTRQHLSPAAAQGRMRRASGGAAGAHPSLPPPPQGPARKCRRSGAGRTASPSILDTTARERPAHVARGQCAAEARPLRHGGGGRLPLQLHPRLLHSSGLCRQMR